MENGKSQIFAKGISGIDKEVACKSCLILSRTVVGEDDCEFGGVNVLTRVKIEVFKGTDDGLIVFSINLRK